LIRINEKINVKEVRVIDDTGDNLGVLTVSEAIEIAKQKGLDLIEISPMAKPPVAKIANFDKYRYQEEKRIKKLRIQNKNQGMKQIQISVKEAQNDLATKANRANKFLKENCRLEILLVLRRREKAHKDFAKDKFKEFMKLITVDYKILMDIKFIGRGFATQIVKKTI
jgi:translation initiation factor IF-3